MSSAKIPKRKVRWGVPTKLCRKVAKFQLATDRY